MIACMGDADGWSLSISTFVKSQRPKDLLNMGRQVREEDERWQTSSDATQEFEVPDSTWQRIAGFARRRVAFSQVWCLSILREILTCLWQSRIEKQSHKHWRARSQKKKCRTLKRNGEWEDASGKFYGSRERRQPLERQCIWPRRPRTPNSICSLLQLHPYRRSCSLWGIRRLYFTFSL